MSVIRTELHRSHVHSVLLKTLLINKMQFNLQCVLQVGI